MNTSLWTLKERIPPKDLWHSLAWLIYLVVALISTIYTFAPKEMYNLDDSSLLYKLLSFFGATKDLAPIFTLTAFLLVFPLLLVGNNHEAFKGRHSLPLFAANTVFFALPLILFPWYLFGPLFGMIFEYLPKALGAFLFALILSGQMFLIYQVKHAFMILTLCMMVGFTAPIFMISLAMLMYPLEIAKILEWLK